MLCFLFFHLASSHFGLSVLVHHTTELVYWKYHFLLFSDKVIALTKLPTFYSLINW